MDEEETTTAPSIVRPALDPPYIVIGNEVGIMLESRWN